jgi:hypothetical protein
MVSSILGEAVNAVTPVTNRTASDKDSTSVKSGVVHQFGTQE